ncbi:NUDIX domain-containing protein [Alphaproteobacteria bacterium]|nr:NUDIX domain-containing protein [Alphaproteobacteria bacterium]
MTKKTLPIDSVCQALDAMEGTAGIGKNLFESISRLTPAVSVELIIKSPDQKSNLLTWRDDELYGPGWHVPGGVVRFKETLTSRVEKVLKNEIGVPASKIEGPTGFHEIFNDQRDIRGHFISFVFLIELIGAPPDKYRAKECAPKTGCWQWFTECPHNLISNQKILAGYINNGK